jgi:hypothetical protein
VYTKLIDDGASTAADATQRIISVFSCLGTFLVQSAVAAAAIVCVKALLVR